MIDVTEEMLKAGIKVWEIFEGSTEQIIRRMYRAMRALEAGPEPLPKPTIAELDALLNSEDRRPVRILPDGSVQTLEPWEIQALVNDQGKGLPLPVARPDRRIDALQALVLLMAGRYQPHNGHEYEELKRLMAELEATR